MESDLLFLQVCGVTSRGSFPSQQAADLQRQRLSATPLPTLPTPCYLPYMEVWRKCVGIEPTGPPEADPQDLKSWANTSPHALPQRFYLDSVRTSIAAARLSFPKGGAARRWQGFA